MLEILKLLTWRNFKTVLCQVDIWHGRVVKFIVYVSGVAVILNLLNLCKVNLGILVFLGFVFFVFIWKPSVMLGVWAAEKTVIKNIRGRVLPVMLYGSIALFVLGIIPFRPYPWAIIIVVAAIIVLIQADNVWQLGSGTFSKILKVLAVVGIYITILVAILYVVPKQYYTKLGLKSCPREWLHLSLAIDELYKAEEKLKDAKDTAYVGFVEKINKQIDAAGTDTAEIAQAEKELAEIRAKIIDKKIEPPAPPKAEQTTSLGWTTVFEGSFVGVADSIPIQTVEFGMDLLKGDEITLKGDTFFVCLGKWKRFSGEYQTINQTVYNDNLKHFLYIAADKGVTVSLKIRRYISTPTGTRLARL